VIDDATLLSGVAVASQCLELLEERLDVAVIGLEKGDRS
jgi:hypothetical protein